MVVAEGRQAPAAPERRGRPSIGARQGSGRPAGGLWLWLWLRLRLGARPAGRVASLRNG